MYITSNQNLRIALILSAVFFNSIFVSNTLWSQTIDTLWVEDWDSGWSDWHVTYGTWEIGTPTSGPDSSFSAPNCAATILDGNYQDYVDSTRLIRHTTFIVPPENENPRLRFWHWYSFRINDNDFGKVQIRIDGQNQWEDLPNGNFHNWDGGIWTNANVDLSDFSGQTVEIAFYFHSDDYYTSAGWYIDNVVVISGDVLFYDPEDWESGFNYWYADYGVWEVGIPSSGPGIAYQGTNCVGTLLDGNYGDYLSSKLISPFVQIPSINGIPRLRFEHWYSFRINDNDYGKVQVRTPNSAWTDLPKGYFNNWTGGVWSNPFIDLSDFADSIVQFAFYFHSDDYYTSSGWYMDVLTIESGELIFSNPENWESGFADWHADYGVWQVGIPSSGPDSAYQGEFCAGTILEGNYGDYLDSRLISPPIQIPSADENPILRFESWYSFRINDNDYGDVEIKAIGDSVWQVLEHYTDASNGWFTPYLPISDYADLTVQIAFHFHSDDYYTSSGWYIDSVRVEPIESVSIIDSDLRYNGDNIQLQNFPNPFTNQTQIKYKITSSVNLHLGIYSMSGELVKTLVDKKQNKGEYSITWDGRNNFNHKVSPGIYYYSLKTNNRTVTKKMILLK